MKLIIVMNQFYSSLVIKQKIFPQVYQVLRPRYNKEYFKRVLQNIDKLADYIKLRCPNDDTINRSNLEILKKDAKEFVRLKEKYEKCITLEPDDPIRLDTLDRLEEIQERVIPIVLSLPNRNHNRVPQEDQILEETKCDFASRQNLVKVLSHTKLSYINKCYSKSVVGPNSHYYQGIGAKLQYALADFFANELESRKFLATSGLSLVKSAMFEAVNPRQEKDYMKDPSRIKFPESEFTTQHIVESSAESLIGFLTTIGHISSNDPLRLYTSGAAYRSGSEWFDGQEGNISQYQSVHALILSPSIEKYSMIEYDQFINSIWSMYKKLELPCRLIRCSLSQMTRQEYAANRIDVWLPSRQEWITSSRISHYLNFITVRSGMKRGHIMDSMIYDGQILGAAIIENRQNALGKFIIPSTLKNHMISLSSEEKENYFESEENFMHQGPYPGINFEQRRYLVKRSLRFSHERKIARGGKKAMRFSSISIAGMAVLSVLLDWEEIWINYVPTPIKRFSYDFIYRPIRKFWWFFTYPKGTQKPKDLPFDEIDKSDYSLTMMERRKQRFVERELKIEIPNPRYKKDD